VRARGRARARALALRLGRALARGRARGGGRGQARAGAGPLRALAYVGRQPVFEVPPAADAGDAGKRLAAAIARRDVRIGRWARSTCWPAVIESTGVLGPLAHLVRTGRGAAPADRRP